MNSIGFLLPETHFFAGTHFAGNTLPTPSSIFMQCYLKIVDEYLWFSFPGNAFLLPETHSSRAVVFFMQCHVKIVDK